MIKIINNDLIFNDQCLGRIKYHIKYWTNENKTPYSVALAEIIEDAGTLILQGNISALGQLKIVFFEDSPTQLSIKCFFTASYDCDVGFYCLGIEFPDCNNLRLLAGCYCGFSNDRGAWKFSPEFHEEDGLMQMSSGIDFVLIPQGTVRTAYQYFCLTFPPAFQDGIYHLKRGNNVNGELRINFYPECSIWNPELKTLTNNEQILSPRYSFSSYIKKWERYTHQSGLWVELGKDMGMFHVGYYKLLADLDRKSGDDSLSLPGGPYGYMLNGKQLMAQEINALFEKNKPATTLRLDNFQYNTAQLEIGWGNGGNIMQAYALYQHGKRWGKQKATAIINALLNFNCDGNGFQLKAGANTGAWIGAYDANTHCFQDHYAGNQIFIPDQGMVNFFLAKIALESHYDSLVITDRIRLNCYQFINKLENRLKIIPHGISNDGAYGFTREGKIYNKTNAPAAALAGLSWLMLYRLTGEPRALSECEMIIEQYLMPELKEFRFGYVEYDHYGYCSAGACWIIIALAEYAQYVIDGYMKKVVASLMQLTFRHLMSFRNEYDFFIDSHCHNWNGFGAKQINKYGFAHGFSAGSAQGAYVIHTRYEYAYALLRYWQTTKDRVAENALQNLLNVQTWHQYNNPRLVRGYGGITEGVPQEVYIQDTAHSIHSCPLTMILIEVERNNLNNIKQ